MITEEERSRIFGKIENILEQFHKIRNHPKTPMEAQGMATFGEDLTANLKVALHGVLERASGEASTR